MLQDQLQDQVLQVSLHIATPYHQLKDRSLKERDFCLVMVELRRNLQRIHTDTIMTQLTIDHKDKLCPISRSGRLTWLRTGTLGTTPSPSGYVSCGCRPSAQESLSLGTLLPELRETHTSQEVLTPRGPQRIRPKIHENSLAQHWAQDWARDWRALALTQVPHWSRRKKKAN